MHWPIFIIYTAIIWLVFAKFKLIRLSLPLAILFASAGPLIILFVLIAMNFYHPGTSDVRVYQRVVQITPRLTTPSRVLEIAAKPDVRLTKGQVLFTIDPVPFQFDVVRLEAVLAAAEQNVRQLEASLRQATASTEKVGVQLDLAQQTYDRQKELFDKNVIAQATLDKVERDRDVAKQAAEEVKAVEDRARLAFQSNVGNVNTSVAQAQQQLAAAKYNLAETTVKAPCDGFVTNIELLPGTIVSASAAVMPFVCDRDEENRGKVAATFDQASFIYVSPGDYAEVIFSMYPGQVLTAKVESTIDITTGGSVAPSGLLPTLSKTEPRFAAIIKLDDTSIRLPSGAQGSGAVYTGKVQFAGTFRMGMIRMTTILNYLAWGT